MDKRDQILYISDISPSETEKTLILFHIITIDYCVK